MSTAPVTTTAITFLDDLRAATANPSTTDAVAQVERACHPLLSAEIERADVEMFGVPQLGQRANIRFADDSHVTALIWWGEDHIDLLEGRHDRPDWLNPPPDKLIITAQHRDPAQTRAFDIVALDDATDAPR